MSPRSRLPRCAALATAGLLGLGLLSSSPAIAENTQPEPVDVTFIGFNDFEGHLDHNTVAFAGTIEELRAQHGEDSTLLLSAGDNIGGTSLPASSSQGDIPTIEVLNALDLAATAVGNHEFDKRLSHLLGPVSSAADFPHLSANAFKANQPLFAAYEIFEVDGFDVAVIGATTETTSSLAPLIVLMDGIKVTNAVTAVNNTVQQIKALADQPDIILAVYHEGAGNPATMSVYQKLISALTGSSYARIVDQTSPDVDAIFTGHTHEMYAWQAPVPGRAGKTRPVIQSGTGGSAIARVTLSVDPVSGNVVASEAENVMRTSTPSADLIQMFPRVALVNDITQAAISNAP